MCVFANFSSMFIFQLKLDSHVGPDFLGKNPSLKINSLKCKTKLLGKDVKWKSTQKFFKYGI